MATVSKPAKNGGKAATLGRWAEALRQVRTEGWGDPMGYLFLAPGLLLFAVFQIWPLIRGFVMAFTDFAFLRQLTEKANFVGIANFVEFFTDDNYFWPSLGRSMQFTAFYLPTMLLLGLFMASAIARIGSGRIAAFFRTSMYLPVILPIAVSVLLWSVMLSNQFGYVNYILKDVLGLDSWALNWLNDKRATLFVVALMRIWRDAGSSAMLFLIGMYNINEELYESAAIDGANGIQKWWNITLPLLKPTLVLVLVLNANIVSAARGFMITYGIGELGPEGSALTLGYYIWLVSIWWQPMRFGYGAAISLFLGVVSAIMSWIIFKMFRTERA
jgi:ABC-type sugar transport system permease subunit